MTPEANGSKERSKHRQANRRNLLKAVGVAGVAGLAGCTSDGSGGGDGGDSTPTSGGDGGTTTSPSGEWSDFSGKEMHFITDETNPEFKKFFNRVGADFEETTGAKTNIEIIAGGGAVEERIAQLVQARDPPEVAFSGAGQVTRFVNTGIAGATTPAVEYAMDRYGEPPSSYRATFDGEDYILPLWANVVQYWYRGDIFDEAPNTWDKLLAQVEKHDGKQGMKGTMIPTSSNLCSDMCFLGFFYSNDGRVFSRSNSELQVALDGEHKTAAVETLEFLNQLYEYSPNTTDFGCGDMSDAIPNTTSMSGYYLGARPKLKAIRRDRPFAADVKVVDGMPSKKSKNTVALSEGLITFKEANTEVANEFMKFMIQEEYINDLLFATPIHNNPIWPKMQSSEGYQQRLNELPDAWSDSGIETALGLSEYGIPFASEVQPPNPFTGAAYGSRALSQMLFDVLEQGTDPSSAVDKGAKTIRQAVQKAQN